MRSIVSRAKAAYLVSSSNGSHFEYRKKKAAERLSVLSIRDVVRDSHALHRRTIVRLEVDAPHLGPPMRFHETKPKKTTSAPLLGQRSKEILAELGDRL